MKHMNISNLTPQRQQKLLPFVRRMVVLLFVTALLAIVGTGCNTARGFGKDVEKTGEKIQDGTK